MGGWEEAEGEEQQQQQHQEAKIKSGSEGHLEARLRWCQMASSGRNQHFVLFVCFIMQMKWWRDVAVCNRIQLDSIASEPRPIRSRSAADPQS